MVRDIDASSDRIKRKVNDIMEEFHVVYAKVGRSRKAIVNVPFYRLDLTL